MIGKKGSFGIDMAMIVVGLFVFIIVILLSSYTLGLIDDNTNETLQSNNASAQLMQDGVNLMNGMDMIFMTVLFLFWMVLLVSVFLIDSHPVFFGIGVFFLLVILFLTIILGDTFTMLLGSPLFGGEIANFPLILWYIDNAVVVIMGMGASVLVALFAKWRLS